MLPELSSPLRDENGSEEVERHCREHDQPEVDVKLHSEVDNGHGDIDQGRQDVKE